MSGKQEQSSALMKAKSGLSGRSMEGFSLTPCTATMTKSMSFSLQACTAQAAKKEIKVGCGSKRKADEDGSFQQEVPAVDVVVVRPEQLRDDLEFQQEAVVYEDDLEFDSDEDLETSLARIKARFEARYQEQLARLPFVMQYKDYSVKADELGAVVGGSI